MVFSLRSAVVGGDERGIYWVRPGVARDGLLLLLRVFVRWSSNPCAATRSLRPSCIPRSRPASIRSRSTRIPVEVSPSSFVLALASTSDPEDFAVAAGRPAQIGAKAVQPEQAETRSAVDDRPCRAAVRGAKDAPVVTDRPACSRGWK